MSLSLCATRRRRPPVARALWTLLFVSLSLGPEAVPGQSIALEDIVSELMRRALARNAVMEFDAARA